MAENVRYNPPPHMDAKALIVRATAKLRAWHEKYGEHQPQWLPPAGDVEWLEDAAAYIAAHTLPAPTAGAAMPVVPSGAAPEHTCRLYVRQTGWDRECPACVAALSAEAKRAYGVKEGS